MKNQQINSRNARRVQQLHLRHLQGPARCRDSALFVRVGISDHDHLAVGTRRKMTTIGRLGLQGAQNISCRFQRINRLEQRRDVERALAGALVGNIGPSRQQQNREYVFGTPRPAHDVFADGAAAEFMTRVGDGFEHPQTAPAHGIECRGRPLIANQQITQLPQPFRGR